MVGMVLRPLYSIHRRFGMISACHYEDMRRRLRINDMILGLLNQPLLLIVVVNPTCKTCALDWLVWPEQHNGLINSAFFK